MFGASTCLSVERFLFARRSLGSRVFRTLRGTTRLVCCLIRKKFASCQWNSRMFVVSRITTVLVWGRPQDFLVLHVTSQPPTLRLTWRCSFALQKSIILQKINIMRARVAIAMSKDDGLYRFVIQETSITAFITSCKALLIKQVQARLYERQKSRRRSIRPNGSKLLVL